jgi:hypothetical protein
MLNNDRTSHLHSIMPGRDFDFADRLEFRRKNSAGALFESEDEGVYTNFDLLDRSQRSPLKRRDDGNQEASENIKQRQQVIEILPATLQIPNSDLLPDVPSEEMHDDSQDQVSNHVPSSDHDNKPLQNGKQNSESPAEEETTHSHLGCSSIAGSACYIEDLKQISEIFDKTIFDTINSVEHIRKTEQELEDMKTKIEDKKRLQKERNVLTAQLSRDRKKIEVELLHQKCYELT